MLAGLPPETVPEIQAEVEALGLAAVLQSEDDDPEADDQVLIAEDSYEMGLWYRLAPVCFMGGTLFEGPSLPRATRSSPPHWGPPSSTGRCRAPMRRNGSSSMALRPRGWSRMPRR